MMEEGCMMKNAKLPVVVDEPQVIGEIIGPLDLKPSKAVQVERCEFFLKRQVPCIGRADDEVVCENGLHIDLIIAPW